MSLDIFGLSLSISTILIYLIDALIAWIAIIISDKIIAHEIEPKKSLVLALASFLVVPIALPMLGIGALGSVIVVSAIVWIGLGELILEADRMTKLKVLIIAFVVYYIISIFLSEYILSLISVFA
jgi:hypothetical protein